MYGKGESHESHSSIVAAGDDIAFSYVCRTPLLLNQSAYNPNADGVSSMRCEAVKASYKVVVVMAVTCVS